MAEFGTFAAALQIAETALKFKKLWDEVRHVAEDLDDSAEEVIVHAEILGSLRRQQDSAAKTNANNEGWKKCHQLFERCVSSLQALTGELTSLRQRHKRTGLVRLYLRKDELGSCKKRLERAQNTMILALHTYSMTVVLDEIQQLKHPATGSIKKKTRPKPALCASNRKLSTNPTVKSYKRPLSRDSHQLDSRTAAVEPLFNLQFPTGTVWKHMQFWFHRDRCSLGLQLRVWNVRSSYDDLFRAGNSGNWGQVCQMISTGLASPFDVDERQTTLLHIAASQARADVCQYLIELGLNASCRTWPDNKTPLETFSSQFRSSYDNEPSTKSSLKTMRLLLTSADKVKFEYSSEPKHWLHNCSLTSHVLSALIAAVIPWYGSVDPLVRSRFALSTTSPDPDSVNVLLGNDLGFHQALRLVQTAPAGGYGHRQLLFNVCRSLSRAKLNDKWRAGWLSVLSSIVSCEKHSRASLPFRSLYMHYIVFCIAARKMTDPCTGHETWNEKLTSIGRQWLETLLSCGVDLARYSKAEKATLKAPEKIFWQDGRGRDHCLRLQFLLCGPAIDDWKVFVVPSTHAFRQGRPATVVARRSICYRGHGEYEMAGDFWNVVENPELYGVPGAFIEDEKMALTVGMPVKVKGPIF